LATMHRVKGLEFDIVIVVSANKGVIPLEERMKNAGDEVERKQAEVEERSLLYVAITRAKRETFILSYA